MSAKGQKRTFAAQNDMRALPVKADIPAQSRRRHIRKRARAFFPSLAASAMLSKKTDEHSTGTALQGQ
jgi:hypothetical protein